MWMDNETNIDLIGFGVHAKLINSIIMDDKMIPVTIGVFGDWGSGKTSMIKMLENTILENEDTVSIYFNSWTFEGYDDAKTAIISSILEVLKKNEKFGSKIKDEAEKLMKSVNWMRALKFGFKEIALPLLETSITGVPVSYLSKFQELKVESDDGDKSKFTDIFDKDILNSDKYNEIQNNIRDFREGFNKLIEKSNIKRLVVLIDDLDRCNPARIVDNLEAIKLFLNVNNTAFIICADPRIVKHAVAIRYKDIVINTNNPLDEYSTDMLITDYLEKLIQVPYYLPRLSPAEIETYMSLLFCQDILDSSNLNKVLNAQQAFWAKNRYGAFGIKEIKKVLNNDDKYSELYDKLNFCSQCATLITEGLKGNPRQVKRFLNTYVLRTKLSRVANLNKLRDDVLVKLMILEYTDDNLFNYLYRKQVEGDGYPSLLKGLEDICNEGKGNIENFKKIDEKFASNLAIKWINLKPMLSDIDLRDYFWIARDKLQNNAIVQELIPPYIRSLLDGLLSGVNVKVTTSSNEVKNLELDERNLIFKEITKEIFRHPKEKKYYDAIKIMIEANVDNSIELLINILDKHTEHAPVAVGVDAVNLLSTAGTEYVEKVQPILEKLSNTKTKIGAAIKKTIERRKVNGNI
ncbi:P-loop NTPase fold protein [Clostridium sp. C2-6-12]|uniref:KAP family P-loop NTPase fold protein n=1 Tax=Clostridium sp. C2-6-12 TaxID=2698832 RepID=UPI00136AFDFE|nr:P-loop NTPase fold protein [Clostridium sp. C2-6-12]